MKIEEVEECISFAFNIQSIADRIKEEHDLAVKMKIQKQQALSISYIMSPNGFAIIELFGFYLSQKMKDRNFVDMGKASMQIFVPEDKVRGYIRTVWPQMGKYERIIPILFKILKRGDYLSLPLLDSFVQVHPLILSFVEKIQKFSQKVKAKCEKEDLLNTGYVEKTVIEDIFKSEFNMKVPDWPQALLSPRNPYELCYPQLLNYLSSGKALHVFLMRKFIRRIIRALKNKIQRNKDKAKGKGKTQARKNIKLEHPKRKGQEPKKKNQKIVAEFIEQNKPKSDESLKAVTFMAKKIVEGLIQCAVQIKEQEGAKTHKNQKLTKSVYVTEPQIPEMQYDEQNLKIKSLKFMGNNGLGLFVSGNQGHMMDIINGKKIPSLPLSLSKIFKPTTIIDYQICNNTIFLLTENGLLYCWKTDSESFTAQIQTSFTLSQSPKGKIFDNDNIEYLKIKDGIIAVNCTNGLYSCIELYSLDLKFIQKLSFNQSIFGLSYSICEQAKIIYNSVLLNKVSQDFKVNEFKQYQQLFPHTENRMQKKLGQMLCRAYPSGFQVGKLIDYCEWILGYQKNSYITFPTSISNKINQKVYDEQVLNYLLKLDYISQKKVEEAQKAMNQIKLIIPKNRKTCLLSLFEDYSLELLKSQFMQKEEFFSWISPACLLDFELKELIESLSFRPDGKIDLSCLFYSEQYRRIEDSRHGRFNQDRYKYQQIPPVCVKNFVVLPSLQIVIISLDFPLTQNFYVYDMLRENILHEVRFDYNSLPPSIKTCQKNGYVTIFSNKTLAFYSVQSFTKKQVRADRIWENLESSEIIDISIIYQQSTLLTLTRQHIKIWDLNELFQNSEIRNVFQLKPGYKAYDLSSASGAKTYKKKIIVRETPVFSFYFISPNDLIVGGVVSQGKNKNWFINSFFINKFKIQIKSEKEHDQIPTKLLRELKQICLKRKNLPPTVRNNSFTKHEEQLHSRLLGMLIRKLKSSTSVFTTKPNLKSELQQKLGNLTSSLCNIYARNVFSQSNENKYENVFRLLTVSKTQQCLNIFNSKFMSLIFGQYDEVSIKNDLNIMSILSECLTFRESKAINRTIYFLSLVQKYTRVSVISGIKLSKLLSEDRVKLDKGKILALFPSQLPMEISLIEKCIKLLNSLSEPVAYASKIIQYFIPSRYRFLVPRYLKQIVTGKQSDELSEFVTNRYQKQPTPQQIVKKIMQSSYEKGIHQYIEKNNLLKYVVEQVGHLFPQTLYCNFSLIESLMCLKVISQDQAIYFAICESNNPDQRLSSKMQNKQTDNYEDKIGLQIYEQVNKKRIKLPYPKTSFTFFKQKLFKGDKAQDFFFSILHGDRQSQETMTQNIETCLKKVSKQLRLKYNSEQWNWIMGSHVVELKMRVKQILSRFPEEYRIVSILDFKTALMSIIDSDQVCENLVKRAAYSCTSSEAKLEMWKQTQGQGVSLESMWIDINHLLKFISEYNPFLLSLKNQIKNSDEVELKIPKYSLISKLFGDFTLISKQKFRQILSLSHRSISISQAQRIVLKYFKQNLDKINVYDLADILLDSFTTIGLYLLNKHHQLDFKNKFTVVNGKVSSGHISSIFNSKALTMFLFGDKDRGTPEFIDFDDVVSGIKKQLIEPAAQQLSKQFAMKLPQQILELIQSHSQKTSGLSAVSLAQMVQQKQSEQSMIICLLKFMSGESDSSQLIDLQKLLDYLRKNSNTNVYKDYLQKISEIKKGKNLIDYFLTYAQPQNLPFTIEDSPRQYMITWEHMKQLVGQYPWFINFKPYASVTEFVHHLRTEERTYEQLNRVVELFLENCVYRTGIEGLTTLLGENPSFPDFVNKLKSSFRSFSKMDTHSLLLLYRDIIRHSQTNKCDASGIRDLCQLYIPIEKKIEWIVAIYDKDNIRNPMENQQQFLDCELKMQKLKILFHEDDEQKTLISIQQLKSSLNYYNYLISKYLAFDMTKMKQISESLKQNKRQEAQSLMEIYGVTNNIHLEQLLHYLGKNNVQEIGRKFSNGEQNSIESIQKVIQFIKLKPQLLSNVVSEQQLIANGIYDQKLYTNFVNSQIASYYCTYHSLMSYCKNYLANQQESPKNRTKYQERIIKFLIHHDMTPGSLHELLDLSTQENMSKLFAEVALTGNEDLDEMLGVYNIFSQMANGLSYPLTQTDFEKFIVSWGSISSNSKQFQQIFSELDIYGNGYVNINEIPKLRGSQAPYLSPYIHIATYIEQIESRKSQTLPSRYMGPIPQCPKNYQTRLGIMNKLLKYQLEPIPNQKTKLIKQDICLAILGEFGLTQDYQYHHFITHKFYMQSCSLLDLSAILDWLMGHLQSALQNDNDQANKNNNVWNIFENIVQKIDFEGGLHSFVDKAISNQYRKQIEQLFKILSQINSNNSQQKISLQNFDSLNTSNKFQFLYGNLKILVGRYFRQKLKWHTFENKFFKIIKQMAQMYYFLTAKFYFAHSDSDFNQIYHKISEKGQLTLFTLWRYIEQQGIIGYSKYQVGQLFNAIDINSDKKISYLQFCQFWTACTEIFRFENKRPKVKTDLLFLFQEINDSFLQICRLELEKLKNQLLTEEQVKLLANLQNTEKIEQIFKSIEFCENSMLTNFDQNQWKSGALGVKKSVQKSKIKIMIQKKNKEIVSQKWKERDNLLVVATCLGIGPFLKNHMNKETLCRVVMANYPHLGYQILQNLMKQLNLNVDKMIGISSRFGNVPNTPQVLSGDKLPKELAQNLLQKITEIYKQYPLKTASYSHEQFGASLAQWLLREQVSKKMDNLLNEYSQLRTLINKIESIHTPVYYKLEQEMEYNMTTENEPLKSINLSILEDGVWDHFIVFEEGSPLFQLQIVSFQNKRTKQQIWRRVIQWKDTQITCKNDNKPDLLLFYPLYNDAELSVFPIDTEKSSRFKIIGAGQPEPNYVPLINCKPFHPQDVEYYVMTLAKAIVHKLLYSYYKYGVSGLLILPQNILVNTQNHLDLKFQHFLSAIQLDLSSIKNKHQTDYVSGIDSKYFIRKQSNSQNSQLFSYPPQIEQGVLTEAIDVYMLAHIVFNFFRKSLTDSPKGKFKQIAQAEEESLWDWSSQVHEKATEKLINGGLSPSQLHMWTFLYECSHHDWFLRPKLYQLHQSLENFFSGGAEVKRSLISKTSEIDILLERSDPTQMMSMLPILSDDFELQHLISLRDKLSRIKDISPLLLQQYNQILLRYLDRNAEISDPQKARKFMENIVDYTLMIDPEIHSDKTNNKQANQKVIGLCSLARSCYKQILTSAPVKRYMEWCDRNWDINQYQISKKIAQINMENKLEQLHYNSSYYHDIYTLAECRMALFSNSALTAKKVAVDFLSSALVSNNLNKMCALYRSRVLKTIYTLINHKELQPTILQILSKASQALNPNITVNRFKTVDQVYKVMMVIANSLESVSMSQKEGKIYSPEKTISGMKSRVKSSSSSSPVKQLDYRRSSQTQNLSMGALGKSMRKEPSSIISMLQLVNNYYKISGEECREQILTTIAKQQIFTLPTLTIAFIEIGSEKLFSIVKNVCWDQEIFQLLKTCWGPFRRKINKERWEQLSSQIHENTMLHIENVNLNQLACEQTQKENIVSLCKKHIKFYRWYKAEQRRLKEIGKIMPILHQNSFHTQFCRFLLQSQKLSERDCENIQTNIQCLQTVEKTIELHMLCFDIWTCAPCHQDMTAVTFRFLMRMLSSVFQSESLYLESKASYNVVPNILKILSKFISHGNDSVHHESIDMGAHQSREERKQIDDLRHPLLQIAIDGGFIQFFMNTLKGQFQAMKKQIEKNVENVHQNYSYAYSAEWRLISFYLLMSSQNNLQISKIMIANGFVEYIVQEMLSSNLILDLRFFKSTQEIVPFRYCHPLKAEAIAMIGFVLTLPECPLADELCSRLVFWISEHLPEITRFSDMENFSNQEDKIEWVETMWLMANIVQSKNERIKYQLLNLGLHKFLQQQIQKRPFMNKFFPEMTQTVTSGILMMSTVTSGFRV